MNTKSIILGLVGIFCFVSAWAQNVPTDLATGAPAPGITSTGSTPGLTSTASTPGLTPTASTPGLTPTQSALGFSSTASLPQTSSVTQAQVQAIVDNANQALANQAAIKASMAAPAAGNPNGPTPLTGGPGPGSINDFGTAVPGAAQQDPPTPLMGGPAPASINDFGTAVPAAPSTLSTPPPSGMDDSGD